MLPYNYILLRKILIGVSRIVTLLFEPDQDELNKKMFSFLTL